MTSFVHWLHDQVLLDKKREMPYSKLYRHGPLIEATIGLEGEFSLPALSIAIREKCEPHEQGDALNALILAEATWRTDTAITENPEVLNNRTPRRRQGICGYRGLDGNRCTTRAVAGAGRCTTHGGAITDPEVRRSVLVAAYARLIGGTNQAVDALIDVLDNSNNDLARVSAAKELLDRAGIVQDQHVVLHANPEGTGGGMDMLKERLSEIQMRLKNPLPLPPSVPSDDEIVDAEVVDP